MDDPSLFKYVGSENSIGILNHKYEIDWLLMMILAERRRLLGVGGRPRYMQSIKKQYQGDSSSVCLECDLLNFGRKIKRVSNYGVK